MKTEARRTMKQRLSGHSIGSIYLSLLASLLAMLWYVLPPSANFGLQVLVRLSSLPAIAFPLLALICAWMLAQERANPRDYLIWFAFDWLYFAGVVYGVFAGSISILGLTAVLYIGHGIFMRIGVIYETGQRVALGNRVKQQALQIAILKERTERLENEANTIHARERIANQGSH
jgi:hypothetical protein